MKSAVAQGALGLVLLFVLGACGAPPSEEVTFALHGQTMGTTWVVKLLLSEVPKNNRDLLKKDIQGELDRVNAEMSHYMRDSEISRFNESASVDWFPVSPGFAHVVSEALAIGSRSGGRLDVTIGPLIDLWGFGRKGEVTAPPSDDELVATKSRLGLQHLEVRPSPPSVRKSIAHLEINLSAIAKGHGVDRVVTLLMERGLSSYFVEVGGEVFASTWKLPGRAWQVGIEAPDPEARSLQRVVPLRGMAMATSGDYRNFWRDQGHQYSHTLDPATGRPVSHAMASVTVIAETCCAADGWATALLVAGPESALALAKEQSLAAFFIIRTPRGFETIATDSFRRLTETDP